MQRNPTAERIDRVAVEYLDRIDACDATITALCDATRAVTRFRRSEVAAHRHAIAVMRNTLTHILDSTEGK